MTAVFSEFAREASSATKLFALLECGQIAGVIGEVEFAAAKEAFGRIPAAVDKHGQVRTCIGHLSSSCAAHVRTVDCANIIDRTLVSRSLTVLDAQNKACFLLCVRAVCHAYLGERSLCTDDLRLAREVRAKEVFGWSSALWFLSGIANPLVAFDMMYSSVRDFGKPAKSGYEVTAEFIAELEEVLLSSGSFRSDALVIGDD